jgi:restriction system protein
MTLPDYQTLMLPLLRLTNDGETHRISDATDVLSDQHGLSLEERHEMLPSGRQAAMANRVGWARTYLTKAGLLKTPQRGLFSITDRGRSLLASNPASINTRMLRQYPEFAEFIGRNVLDDDSAAGVASAEKTPEEIIESIIVGLDRQLADDLLQIVRELLPEPFEKLVLTLLSAMGYGGFRDDAARHTGMSGDQGIDGVIDQDELGLDAVYIQAKHWTSTVGGPEVRTFAGSLAGKHASKGVLITPSSFTADAKEFVRIVGQRIVLIDGRKLAELMIKHGVGVSTVTSYTVKRPDTDFFTEL